MQKDKNSMISVNSTQKYNDHEEKIEIITEGNFYYKNNKYYILYEEIDTESRLKSISTIKVESDRVSIKRQGAFSSSFVCKQGESTSFLYHMPYGDMVMDIKTTHMNISLGDNGGKIELIYTLEVNTEKYLNHIIITVNKK